MTWLTVGSIFAFLSVALGAFGAHALKEKLTPERLTVFQTGVQYEMYHAIGLFVVGLLSKFDPAVRYLPVAGWLFTVGIVLFSGSLYLLCLTGFRKFGAITPLGGLCFL